MKQTTVAALVLSVLAVLSWVSAAKSLNSDDEAKYREYIEEAEVCVERGLYARAVREYKNAISIMPEKEVYDKAISASGKRYSESPKFYSDYVDILQQAIQLYPDDVNYVLTLAGLYKEKNDYVSEYDLLNEAVSNGINDTRINELLTEAKYAYRIITVNWQNIGDCVNQKYTAEIDGMYYYVGETGEGSYENRHDFTSPVGENGTVVLSDEDGSYIMDGDGVLLGKLDFIPSDAGVFSEGLVPISKNGVYSYYNSYGDFQFGDFSYAGTFKSGRAAVKKGQSWYIVDNTGNRISGSEYDLIVLLSDGTFEKDGVMIAEKGGRYFILDSEGEEISFDSIGILTDDKIVAVKTDGKWGFSDLNGNQIIPAEYNDARSFSHGLAAVCKDGLWGFADISGRLVIDYAFSDVGYFNSMGCCPVKDSDGMWQMLSLYNY